MRLNLSKSGVGASVGIPGLRYTVDAHGRTRRTASIPGTGISSVSYGKSGSSRAGHGQVVAAAQQVVLPKPGWLAPAPEKRYYEGVVAYLGADWPKAHAAFEAVAAADPSLPSAHFIAAMAGAKAGAPDAQSLAHLEAVVASDVPMPDRFQAKYLPPAVVQIALSASITEHIKASLPFNAAGATLLLAEEYQEQGRLEEAIGLITQLHETYPGEPVVALSLADLLFADADYDGVLEATKGATNDTDVGAGLLHMRGAALYAQGHHDGACEAFKLALAKTAGRDPELLKVIRYDRALAYEAAGQKAKAKADLEKLYGQDPGYLDVRERLTGYAQ